MVSKNMGPASAWIFTGLLVLIYVLMHVVQIYLFSWFHSVHIITNVLIQSPADRTFGVDVVVFFFCFLLGLFFFQFFVVVITDNASASLPVSWSACIRISPGVFFSKCGVRPAGE